MPPIDLRTESYGPLEAQEGDLFLPPGSNLPVVCLLHGGFWRMPYGREQMTNIAQDLALHGFAVWNLEYRRLGAPTSGWPGTFDDVMMGIEHLVRMVAKGINLDLTCVTVVGHSAGGQLALWAATRQRAGCPNDSSPRVQIAAVVAQAAVADLARAYDLRVGGSAVAELMGGAPADQQERYEFASPQALLPLDIPQLVLHGTADDVVPIEIARAYAQAARDAGDKVEFLELAGAGHMDYLDPSSKAHAALCSWLVRHQQGGI
jgi:acetyl esterase/lipase